MSVEEEVQRFRMELLRKVPFYGDVLMRLPLVANPSIPTARTDGRRIEYSPAFFQKLNAGQQHFVLLHEVFHVLLFHCRRNGDKDPRLWNTAADLIVNSMLTKLRGDMNRRNIAFQPPPDGIYGSTENLETVENLYEHLRKLNNEKDLRKGVVHYELFKGYRRREAAVGKAPEDLLYPAEGSGSSPGESSSIEREQNEAAIRALIREAAEKARGELGSFFLPDRILKQTESRRLDWRTLLRSFLEEELSEDSSYITPERKYLHMDLILPGHSREELLAEEIWAFVDSSGSVGTAELEQFLTQLDRIAREFKCMLHLCYWDTQVTDVYRKIRRSDKIWECLPRHSGGTDINCVYRWLRQERIRPQVMLILTDGYFGSLKEDCFLPALKRNTILVLSGNIAENEQMRRIGKIARLNQ